PVEGPTEAGEGMRAGLRARAGDGGGRPRGVAPHQRGLDWQMWFAALGDASGEPWFQRFCRQLLAGSSDVLRLLAYDPFAGRPPKYIRAVLYQYHYASPDEHRRGIWWRRGRLGDYVSSQALTP